MAENTQERKTFKYGDQDYLSDDFLRAHAEYKQSFLNFAKSEGLFDEASLQALSAEMDRRANAVREGKSFSADGILEGDKVNNVSYEVKNPRKHGLKRKDRYMSQDITEWAKHYVNKLLGDLKSTSQQNTTNTGTWDLNKHGLSAYLTGQGLTAQDVFEKYDMKDPSKPEAARSFAQRRQLLLKHLPGYKQWLQSKGFDFTKNDNDWDDTFSADFDTFLNDYTTNENYDNNSLIAALRKFGAGDFTDAFTSDRWELNKSAHQSSEEARQEAERRKKEAYEKQKQTHMREYEDYARSRRRTSAPVYYKPFNYSNHNFNGKQASFENWYGDLNDEEKAKYGTYLGRDNAAWRNAWTTFTNALKQGTQYSDANAGVLLQGTFENQPHGFIELGDGTYLISDSITDDGQGTIYDPRNGFVDTVFLGDWALKNDKIREIYRQLAYKYLNTKYKNQGIEYKDDAYVFKVGGAFVEKYQYGQAVTYNWGSSDDSYKEKADKNNVSVKTQKAKDQYLDPDNKSLDNPNAGWDPKHYARLGSAVADLGAAITGFIPGWGTVASGVLGFGSTIANFGTDLADDAVTSGEMWKNLGLNLGMDILGLIPGGGAASKMGKIVKTLKGTVPLIVALPGVASMLANSPEIAASWKKAFDGDPENGGSKMDYQDYMNILQVLNVAAGAVNIGRNVYQSSKKVTTKTDQIAVDVTDKSGKRRALVLEGDDATKFKEANEAGKAQEFLNEIEGGYKINEVTTGNHGKFWGKDQNGEFHLQNPFGQTGTGRARILDLKYGPNTNWLGYPQKTKTGKIKNTLYAETGRWESDLGINKGELIYAKDKPRLEAWKQQQQTDLNDQFTQWRTKAQEYKAKIDDAAVQRDKVKSDIESTKSKQQDLTSQLAEQEHTELAAYSEAEKIQNWLTADGVATANKKKKQLIKQIDRLYKQKKGLNPYRKRLADVEIKKLENEIEAIDAQLSAYTPEAVQAARDKGYAAYKEQNKIKIEQAKLKKLLKKLNSEFDTHSKTAESEHSDEFNKIKDFKAIKKKFNDKEYTFDVPVESKNLDNLFKSGGTINRTKINKFINYAKG